MGAHTTSDDPTRYRLAGELETWRLKDPIERLRRLLGRSSCVDQAFFDALDAEAETLAVRLREGCRSLPDPEPDAMFDQVYAEPHPLVDEERAGYRRVPRVASSERGRASADDETADAWPRR